MSDQRRRDADRYRLLVKHAPICIHEIDADGRLLLMNVAGRAMMGFASQAQVVGLQYLAGVAEPDRPRVAELMAKALAGEQSEFEFRVAVEPPKHFASCFIPIVDDGGEVLRLMGVSRDITARKAAEAAQAARTEELLAVNEDLAAFAWSISHDLRAPLRSIANLADLLEIDHGADLGEGGCDYTTRIKRTAARMDQMIADLLEYSRLGRAELETSAVDLDAVFRVVLESLDAGSDHVQVLGPLGVVVGFARPLEQVAANLVGNALKFVPPEATPAVRVWTEVRGPFTRLFVEDNGIGIAPAHRDQVFGVFKRLHRSYSGTGIGLAIVRRVVERLGGQVGIEDAAGQGARFWCELPTA